MNIKKCFWSAWSLTGFALCAGIAVYNMINHKTFDACFYSLLTFIDVYCFMWWQQEPK